MPKEDVVEVPAKKGFEASALIWFVLWFTVINLFVYMVFDLHFFERVSAERLLMKPSENQVERVIAGIQQEKNIRHIIFLGNSIVWGVGVDSETQTMVGRVKEYYAKDPNVRVLSLAVPGESVLDSFAALKKAQNDRDVFVYVINTTFVEDHARYATFNTLVHFPVLVQEQFSHRRHEIESCCGIAIPPARFSNIHTIARRTIPLYRNRDSLAQWMLGLSFPDAQRAVLTRLFSGNVSQIFERKPMAWEHTSTPHRPLPKSKGSWPLVLLSKIFSENGRAKNIVTVLIDDDRYDHGKETLENVALIRRALSGGTLIDFYGKLDGKFYDTLHLDPSGHNAVAKALIPAIDTVLHAP